MAHVKRSRRVLSEKEKYAAWLFKLAAVGKPCVLCGAPSADAHHGVEKQYLRRHHPGTEWDKRNCVPTCRRCHEKHSTAHRRLPRAVLPGSVEEFATEVLGAYGDDYLRRYYETEQAA